jgi:hypothetical protein
MTQLPATYVDARALEFARDWIAWHRESPNGMFHPNAAAVYGTSLMKQFAQSHPFGADDVAYFAEHGSKALQNWIRKRGFPRGQLTGRGPGARTKFNAGSIAAQRR